MDDGKSCEGLCKQAYSWKPLGGSRKNEGGKPNIVGIIVAQFNALLEELQLRTSLMISQIPV